MAIVMARADVAFVKSEPFGRPPTVLIPNVRSVSRTGSGATRNARQRARGNAASCGADAGGDRAVAFGTSTIGVKGAGSALATRAPNDNGAVLGYAR